MGGSPLTREKGSVTNDNHSQEALLDVTALPSSPIQSKEDLRAIREAAAFGMPLGNDRFKAQIEKTLGRTVGYARRGRPKKRTTTNADE